MIYSCEDLGTPAVGYKLNGTTIEQHLENEFAVDDASMPTQLKRYFTNTKVATDEFVKLFKESFSEAISEATEKTDVDVEDFTIDIHTKNKQKYGTVVPTRFKVGKNVDRLALREELNSLDWDDIVVEATRKLDGELEDSNKALPLVDNEWAEDERWQELFDLSSKPMIDKFDNFYWDAFHKLDSLQWHSYCYQHGYANKQDTKVHPSVDFMCWCIDTQDYDNLMEQVYGKQVNAMTGIDLFASINTNTTTQTPIKESGNTTAMATTPTTQTAMTAQTPVTEAEQKKFFAGALLIPQIAASEKVWARSGGTFETIVLYAKDVDAYFTCDTKIVKTTGKPSNKKYQWIVVDGEKFSWNNIGDATLGFEALAKEDYAGMAKFMTEPCAKRWMQKLNGEVETPKAETPKVEQPKPAPKAENVKPETPKAQPQFKGVTYNEPSGDGIYHLVWVSADKCHIYGINGKGIVEVDMVLDKENTERCIAQASLKQIATPEKFFDALRKLKLEVAPAPAPKAKEEPKTEAPKVVKTLDSKPQPKVEKPAPKKEEPKQTPKADRLTIDKRDGGLFISGADADTAEWIMAYVDSINAMKMRQIG